MKRIILALGFIIIWCPDLLAQTVKGKVTENDTGKALPGVNVVVKGAPSLGTATDQDGNYQLKVNSLQDTLVFSFVGFKKKNVPIKGREQVNVAMSPQTFQGEEIVVSGYQIQEKANVTGAISTVDPQDLENKTASNPIKSLQGQVAGLYVSTSGDPTGGAQVRIRGVNTLNNNDPLYVIDGVPTKESAFQVLNPQDIKSIQVLKDAPSAAIYGARASNGVILVTTKKAKENTFAVNYSSKVTLSDYTTKPSMLDAEGRARAQWRAAVNDGLDPDQIPNVNYDWQRNSDGTATLNGVSFPEMIAPGYKSSNTDWYDAITKNGVIQEHNLSITTGGNRGGALMSLRYYNDDYIMKYKQYEKYTARVNSHYNFDDGKIKIGENLSFSNGIDKGLHGPGPFGAALNVRPLLPVYTESGGYSGPPTGAFVDSENPLMVLDYNKWDQTSALNLLGNIYANFSVTDNLSINSNFGIDWGNQHYRDIQRTYQTGYLSRDVNSLQDIKSQDFTWNLNATVQYQLDIGKSSATFLAGTEATKNTVSQNSSTRQDFAIETLDYFVEDAGSGSQFVGGYKSGFSLLSYFGKVDYSYEEKYLASATLRYDGSSKFGTQNKYGAFPSFTVGWRMSEEPFIKNNLDFVSNFKVRVGWGQTGNQEIANDARFTLFEPSYGSDRMLLAPWSRGYDYANYGTAYDLEGADSGPLPSGFRRIQTGNERLRWESTTETNIGIDYGFLEEKITGSIDYFTRHTDNILISPVVIAVEGEGSNRFLNGASVKTNGWEVSATYHGQISSLNYSVRGNLGHYNDEITKLPPDVVDSYPGNSEKTILGHSMNSLFGYVADGIFKNQQEVDNHADQPGKGIGRIRYKDLNGDGKITPLDQKYLGTTSANYEFGLNLQANYKHFDASVFFQGVYGREVYDARKERTDFTSLWAGTNYGTRTLEAWSPQNKDSNIPALTLADNNDEGRMSTYFVANGSYLKLRQASVGYNFQNPLVFKRLRIFIMGENLLTVKDNSGADAFTSPDPENPTSNFPRPRKLTLGINISF